MKEGLNLRVEIDNNSGFCFGVVYAVEMAEDVLAEDGELYCLGDIVHNGEEVKRLENKGLKIIDHEGLKNVHDSKVLIRAHGEPPSTYELALKNNIELIDASCPVVLKLQNRIKNSYDKGGPMYILGKHGHAEVNGLLGQTNNEAVVFTELEELDTETMPKEITLYSQTTKSTDKLYRVRDYLEEKGITVNFNDTICRQVSNRDKDLKDFANRFDKIVFVAGRKSSNGQVLYNVCRQNNPQSFFVSTKDELEKNWFSKGESIGICGATSTPMWLMEDVKGQLESY